MTEHALLFTDLVGSTQLAERLGDAAAAAIWTEHDRRARDLLARHNGREIDRSDGFFFLFDQPVDAARYALDYHRELDRLALQARVGIHAGFVSLRVNHPDDVARGAKRIEVDGIAKHFASRIMALASGGQTLVSRAAHGALGQLLPEGCELQSHGHYRLKGIEEPVEAFELGERGRCSFLPPEDTDKAYRVVRSGTFWQPVRHVRQNLPPERDAFVGRSAELRELARRIETGIRLLSVLGPAGSGKTRLVRHFGWGRLGDWPGGIYFCDLSEARSLDGILFCVASALDIPIGGVDAGGQIGHAIAGRGRCLIIADNFEQVQEHASATLGKWLDRAADATFLVTSRERLQLPGEEVLPLDPLPLASDAIALFEARARALQPEFAPGGANAAAVAEVVRLLDGLPLAIELAAARIRVLSPAQLVQRMRDRFRILSGVSGAVGRQATLRAAIDWSWDLLAPWEQDALAQCSVFEGGFLLEAAEAVVDLSAWPDAPSGVDVIQALVDKSLLYTWGADRKVRYDFDEPHFAMYLSIHEYAEEKLRAGGCEVAAQMRHAKYFAGFGAQQVLESLGTRDGARRGRALRLEIDNLVAACRRAVAHVQADHAVGAYRAAWEVIELRGPFQLGRALGAEVLALGNLTAAQRVDALRTRALAARRSGAMEDARIALDQALALAKAADNPRMEATIRFHLGSVLGEQSRNAAAAEEHLAIALTIFRREGERRREGAVLANLGNIHLEHGRLNEALAEYEACLSIHREVEDQRFECVVLGNRALLHSIQGDTRQAKEDLDAALAIAREIGDRRTEGLHLGNLGSILLDQRLFSEAQDPLRQALAIARELGNRRHEGFVLLQLGNTDLELGDLADAKASFDASLAIHRELGDRRLEGNVLGSIGDLFARQGRNREALEVLRAGTTLLQEAGDWLCRASFLCSLGLIEAAAGNRHVAAAALAEAEAAAANGGVGAEAPLGRDIARLRAALGDDDDGGGAERDSRPR